MKKVVYLLCFMVFSVTMVSCTDNTQKRAKTKQESVSNNKNRYDSSLTAVENINNLNRILEEQFSHSFTVTSKEDYEKAGQSDWMFILEENQVGIDTATWKYDYAPDSAEEKYMEAMLRAFSFYYGDEMGKQLWLLTGDLIDDGADESQYGFTHFGGDAIYKDKRKATYAPGNNNNMYLWLTP